MPNSSKRTALKSLSTINQDSGFLRTAESVSPKHPDKLCDRVSDAILDAYLSEDKFARVAVDCAGGHGQFFATGEVTSSAKITNDEIEKIIRNIIGDNIKLIINIKGQSPEISRGVDTGGAGDQGIMIGYACDETPELLPKEVVLARRFNQFIYNKFPFDGKTQVTLRGDNVTKVVASFQNASQKELKALATEFFKTDDIELFLNPCGDWSIGGFDADAGLTGRKLAVDNYGPSIPVGGGAFSGKDPSKVDRSAAYAARRIAVDYLKKFKAHEVYVRLAYAIGWNEPLERTAIIDGKAVAIPESEYDLSPRGIIESLDLLRPIYAKTAEYGHFGEGFDWDKD